MGKVKRKATKRKVRVWRPKMWLLPYKFYGRWELHSFRSVARAEEYKAQLLREASYREYTNVARRLITIPAAWVEVSE